MQRIKYNYAGLIADNGYRYPSEAELRNIFASSCVESAAVAMGLTTTEMYRRMEKVNLFKDFIYPCYDSLHTQSREHVTEDVLDALKVREKKNRKGVA